MSFTLAVITARGGSKGIPFKNIAMLRGRPLISYTIAAAIESKNIDAIILSTDSQQIADTASRYGIEACALRPMQYATDTANNTDAVIYEVDNYEKKEGVRVDVVVLLQPTAPLRTAEDIDNALELFFKSRNNSLISVYQARAAHPNIMYYQHNNETLLSVLGEGTTIVRRQEFQPVYVRNGAIYIAKRQFLAEKRSFVEEPPMPYIMPEERSINIDEPLDLEMAEWFMERNERIAKDIKP